MTRIKLLESTFASNQKDLKSKEDCIVAALHCILINADFLCVGLGDEFSDNDSESVTELLPAKWNENQDVYSLRYKSKDLKDSYLLKVVKAGSNLYVDVVLNQDKFWNITVNTGDYVSDEYKRFSQAYKNLDQLNDSFQKEILGKIQLDEQKPSAPTSTEPQKIKSPKKKPDQIPGRVPMPHVQPIPIGVPDTSGYGQSRYPGFPQIGSNDLDPLGRSQGSMLFDPTDFGRPSRGGPFGGSGFRPMGGGPMGLPPHAVPPGARFDPFSPINPGRFDPEPDHFKPPDYDNMFM